MRVVRGFEYFCCQGRCRVLILQFGGEVGEAILRECSYPFREHDGHTGVDFGADGYVGGVLPIRLNKRILPCVGNEHRRSSGKIWLHTSVSELVISKQRESQAQYIEPDSPCR